jgi:hypothetical protein
MFGRVPPIERGRLGYGLDLRLVAKVCDFFFIFDWRNHVLN